MRSGGRSLSSPDLCAGPCQAGPGHGARLLRGNRQCFLILRCVTGEKSHSSSLQEVTDPSVMTSFLHHVHLKIETLQRSALFLVYFHAPLFPSFSPKGTRLQVGTRLRQGPYCSASSAYASAPVCWLLAIHKRSSSPFTQRSRHTKLTLGLFWGVRHVHLWLSAPTAEGLVLGARGWCSSMGRPPCTCPSAGSFEGGRRCGGSPKHIFAQIPPPRDDL